MDKIKKAVLSFFFPKRCALCRKVIHFDNSLCEKCEKENVQSNFCEYLHLKRSGIIMPCVSPFLYKDNIRTAVHRMKFRNCPDIAEFFAEKIYEALFEHNKLGFDIITCVPMTKTKENERGYNQAELIARNLSKISGIPFEETLVKIKENKRQHELSRSERILNVKGVYACEFPEKVKGRRILLIDDVITTGNTVSECADTLYKSEAAAVECASAAKA